MTQSRPQKARTTKARPVRRAPRKSTRRQPERAVLRHFRPKDLDHMIKLVKLEEPSSTDLLAVVPVTTRSQRAQAEKEDTRRKAIQARRARQLEILESFSDSDSS